MPVVHVDMMAGYHEQRNMAQQKRHMVQTISYRSSILLYSVNAAPQASADRRLMWRLAPRLLERWSAAGSHNAVHAAVTSTTEQVGVRNV